MPEIQLFKSGHAQRYPTWWIVLSPEDTGIKQASQCQAWVPPSAFLVREAPAVYEMTQLLDGVLFVFVSASCISPPSIKANSDVGLLNNYSIVSNEKLPNSIITYEAH